MLANNLRDDYIENKHSFDVDEWPPDQPTTVVNVALIHYKGSRTEQELIEISKRHKEGTPATDKLAHDSRVTKDISKIFQTDCNNSSENEMKSPKFILIEGAPGIGKTVLAKKITNLWAKKKILTDVNILFLLFLRDPGLHHIKTPEQLIQYVSNKFDEEQVKDCVKQIKKLQVGFIMDGFDEYPIKLRKKSFITDLIKDKVFHDSIVVITSRPTATINLHDKVDRRVEILGFAQEERDKYISDSLDSPDQRKQIQDYLKCQPIINGLIYVPLHLAVLLYLFKIQSKLPETLTEMNESFIIHTIYRSLTKDNQIPDAPVITINSIKEMPKNVLVIVKELSKLAFIGLQNNQLVFSYKEVEKICPEIRMEIPGAFNGFGLLQVVQHFSKKGAGTTVSFNFLHFTMQEFLAALHVANIDPHEQQLSLMKKTFWNSTYIFMWMMYVGIKGINSQTFMQFVYNAEAEADIGKLELSNNIKLNKMKCLHLFQCFMEAKSKEVPEEISNIFYNNEINFHSLRLLPHHISSLTLYVSKYSMQIQSLNLRDCHIGDVGMSILEHYFTANPDKASSIKHIDLFGNNSVLLWNVYCTIFGQQNLTKLEWSSLGGVNIEEIINVMDNNMTVISLNLSDNHFNDDDANKIAQVLGNNTTLQELDFSKNNITTKGAIAISECLHNNVKLQHLKFSWNNHFINTNDLTINFSQRIVNDTDARIVTNILCKNEIATKLDLSKNKISDKGAESISKCIESNKSLTEIDISGNKISNIGFRKIAISLQINQTVQKLNISHNKISEEGIIILSDCLKNNNTLQELTISWNDCKTAFVLDGKNKYLHMGYKDFGNVGTTLISSFLFQNDIAETLDISHNKISDDGAIAISEYLRNNRTLQQLDISHNQVSNIGMIEIGKALQTDTTLQMLKISHNNISDDGAVAISEFLENNNTLQQLDISHNQVSNIGIIKIGKALQIHTTLQILNTSHNKISDDGAVAISEYLKNNNTLQQLDISHNQVSNIGMINIGKALQINATLQTLDISHNNISDDGALAIGETLRGQIHCKDNSMVTTNKGTTNEVNIKNRTLQKLNISYNDITSKGIIILSDCLKNNNTLQELTISWNDCKTAFILDGTNKYFNMGHMHFGDVGTTLISAFLFQNDTAEKLNISHNMISDDGAVAISEYLKNDNTLRQLDISHNQVSNIGMINIGKVLEMNSTLQILDISHNNISDDGAVAIGETLRGQIHSEDNSMVTTNKETTNKVNIKNHTLQKLNISYNDITSKGIIILSDCLKNNNTLQELTISWNDCETAFVFDGTNEYFNMGHMHFGDIGTTLISAFLFQNDTTEKLNISHNHISDDGAVAISEYLKNNNTLQLLVMSQNQVSDVGISKIGKALQINTTLLILNISHNNISDDGAVSISECLKNNSTLQQLDISHNQVSNVGMINIGKALQINSTLQILDISHNNISDDGAVAISEYLENNSTLLQLDISHNQLSNVEVRKICEVMQKRCTMRQKFDILISNLSLNFYK